MTKFRRQFAGVLTALALASFTVLAQTSSTTTIFRENKAWTQSDGALTATQPSTIETALMTRGASQDSTGSLEFKAPKGARGELFTMGRYAIALEGTGDWTPVSWRFRAPRFDEGYNKKDNALLLEAHVGAQTLRNVVYPTVSPGARWESEDFRGPTVIFVRQGPLSIRNVRHEAADYAQVTVPAATGGETNEKSLVDTVALGKELFTSVGCEACHRVAADDAGVSSGPNLFGLFRPDPRQREIVEGGEGHRFTIKANRDYLRHSLRAPADQLAIAERGPTAGQAYLPVMPPFTPEILSDAQIDALGDYLTTLNEPGQRGPVTRLTALTASAPYDPMTDGLQWLVDGEVRLQRGPLPGVSARSIHVGNPNGIHYTFDPRLLAVAKVWQGGFLDMSGELVGRGGKGLALGYESREISLGGHEYLVAPLDPAGKAIDFSFKDAKFGDSERLKAALNAKEDQADQIKAVDAQFLGYSRDSKNKLAAPAFRYRVGRNTVEIATSFADSGAASVVIGGTFTTPQTFTVNGDVLKSATVSAGKLDGDRWTLPAGKTKATLTAQVGVAKTAWKPAASTYSSYKVAPVQKAPAKAAMPAGYSIENYYPPKDNYGRDQLFEALGLAVAKDGTIVVATRTAGIWRLVNGEWRKFAEGLFDSLGVVVEDGKGLVVVAGQKAELTRISDTNGDGIADRYDTLFDAHSYHGNYHSYMHGPVRGADGSYYLTLNLVHDGSGAAWMGGGNVMGTYGGYNGWAVRVKPDGSYELFANGLRSPASLGVAPDGRVFYTDNQGDFNATSKMYWLKKDGFYGHPAGLVDLPGMTPASPEIQWPQVLGRKEQAIALFPHNRVANSPGNPAWVTSNKFGPFNGQILIGDQTQSNLLRVAVQKIGDVEQASVMPFFDGLESGVMRPVFLPDGSLLLGQTGRGWQAKGGKVASLQHVRWDGKTIAPQILAVAATHTGFRVDFTQPLSNGVSENILRSALSLESWTYRDAPDYGSPELDLRNDTLAKLTVSADRKSLAIDLASTEIPQAHPVQTARVYHVKLASQTLFDVNAPGQLDAYATVRRFP
ncbi:MAG TPA: c-type cytochrome [Steroidobacteraceae bacterium]|nr:c-type cytochrome [Steroidobacteraceae bacterium]